MRSCAWLRSMDLSRYAIKALLAGVNSRMLDALRTDLLTGDTARGAEVDLVLGHVLNVPAGDMATIQLKNALLKGTNVSDDKK